MESVRSVISIPSIAFTASEGNDVVVTSGVYQIDCGSESQLSCDRIQQLLQTEGLHQRVLGSQVLCGVEIVPIP